MNTQERQRRIRDRVYEAADEGRTVGCELRPSRYDVVAMALGGHGEHVERPEDLEPALERALASGLPACVNVMVDGVPAPTYRAAPAPAH